MLKGYRNDGHNPNLRPPNEDTTFPIATVLSIFMGYKIMIVLSIFMGHKTVIKQPSKGCPMSILALEGCR